MFFFVLQKRCSIIFHFFLFARSLARECPSLENEDADDASDIVALRAALPAPSFTSSPHSRCAKI